MAYRSGGQAGFQAYAKPNGFEQITGLNTVKGLTPPAESKYCIIQPEAQNVRWRDDGTDPTTGVGMIIVANDTLVYSGDFSAIKFIEVTATAKLNVSYYK